MVSDIVRTICAEFSSANAKRVLAEIIQHHRVQVSPGFRDAAQRTAEMLKNGGLKTEIFSFPSDGKTHYFSYLSPEEWHATEASLWLTRPKREKLADYSAERLSLIQRSAPCRTEAQIVVLQDGEERSEYRNIDVAGKIVLTKGDLRRVYELAVEAHGALGIVYDGIRKVSGFRDRYTVPDAVADARFAWTPKDKRCFGFVISARNGERLRALIAEETERGRTCTAQAKVNASFREGEIQVVSGFIPGATDEEVWLIAHLCHPEPSANDNASGAATVVESARTLASLIRTRKLPNPRRGLRFLLVPEILGTCAYLASRRKIKAIAGCNLDMVGQNQSLCGSSFLIERTPHASASFTDILLQRIQDELMREATPFSGSASYPLFRHAVTPFSGGSDHAVLSDPTIGIPSPMLIQWPDYYYHTNQDTLDKVDAKMLRLAGVMASSYVYFVAHADHAMVNWLVQQVVAHLKTEVIQFLRSREGDDGRIVTREIEILRELVLRTLDSLKSFEMGDLRQARSDLRRFLAAELKASGRGEAPQKRKRSTLSPYEKRASTLVPFRTFKAPANVRSHRHLLTEREKDALHTLQKKYSKVFSQAPVLAQYWMDGKRSLLEITELIEFETSSKDMAPLFMQYFKILTRIGLIGMKAGPR